MVWGRCIVSVLVVSLVTQGSASFFVYGDSEATMSNHGSCSASTSNDGSIALLQMTKELSVTNVSNKAAREKSQRGMRSKKRSKSRRSKSKNTVKVKDETRRKNTNQLKGVKSEDNFLPKGNWRERIEKLRAANSKGPRSKSAKKKKAPKSKKAGGYDKKKEQEWKNKTKAKAKQPKDPEQVRADLKKRLEKAKGLKKRNGWLQNLRNRKTTQR